MYKRKLSKNVTGVVFLVIEEINEKKLEEYIKSYPNLLVNFYVPKLIGSDQKDILSNLQSKFKNTIKIVIINAEKCSYWPQKLKFTVIPVILFFKDGVNRGVRRKGSRNKLGSQLVGFININDLIDLTNSVFFIVNKHD